MNSNNLWQLIAALLLAAAMVVALMIIELCKQLN